MTERRIAERVVPGKKLEGRLQLQANDAWVDVKEVMDISPFGVRVHLQQDIRKSGEVLLRLEASPKWIEVKGAIAWLIAGAGNACMAGISLAPENVRDNTLFFEVIVGTA